MSSLDMSSLISITDLPKDVGFSTFMLHLYNKEKYTDIDISVSSDGCKSTFAAHKMVLALRSPCFAERFYGPNKKVDNVNVIELDDVDPEAFKILLKFMYDSMPRIDTPKKTFNIYKVAKQFGVNSLMNKCRETLNGIEILPTNVLDMLEVSDFLQNDSTKDRCLRLIQANFEEVKESYQLPNISSSMIHILIKCLNKSNLFNLNIMMWIFAWGKNKFVENHKVENTRQALEEVLPKLPFLCLSNVEFAKLIESYENVLTPDEIISIFMKIANPEYKKMPSWYMAAAED